MSTGAGSSALARLLRDARKEQGLSQLELAALIGVSQRHLSFVELSRARPSRSLLVAWMNALRMPASRLDETLVAAGFAPLACVQVPIERSLHVDGTERERSIDLLRQLIAQHDPAPAFILDANWNILHLNRGAAWLARAVMPNLPRAQSQVFNMLDLLLHPQGFCASLQNLRVAGPAFLSMLRAEAAANPLALETFQRFRIWLHQRLPDSELDVDRHAGALDIPAAFRTEFGLLSFQCTYTTFGRPSSISQATPRVEHMFPADEATEAVLAQRVSSAGR